MTSQTQKMTRKRSKKMQPFFDLVDDYTGIYLYAGRWNFSVRKKLRFSMEKNMRFRSFFELRLCFEPVE